MTDTTTVHLLDDDGDKIAVTIAQLGKAYFKAYVTAGKHNDLDVRGYGDTMMAAIADLNDAIKTALDNPQEN